MSDFLNQSKTIVTDFLQNVVIIDDEAYSEINSTPKVVHVNRPVSRAMKDLLNSVELTPVIQTAEKEHRIDIKVLTDNFASQGLLCSVLRPEEQEIHFVKKTKAVLKKADIIVLDWNIKINGKESDETVKELIVAIVSDENKHQQKSMRYIAIYSGEDNLTSKLLELKSILDGIIGMSGNIVKDYKLLYDHLQINIYAKESQKSNTDPTVKISDNELANAIIMDFTTLIHGIVPNLALYSLAAIRKNTHRILTKFSNKIDDAYLAHKAMLPEPNDAELLLSDILTDELQSIIDDSNVDLTSETLKNWLDHKFAKLGQQKLNQSYKDCYFNQDYYVSQDEFIETMSFCVDSSEELEEVYTGNKTIEAFVKQKKVKLSMQLKEDIHDCIFYGIDNIKNKQSLAVQDDSPKFSKILTQNNRTPLDGLNEFAILSTNKTFYTHPKPYLTLGTILKKGGKYFISLMPRCDAARINKNQKVSFPLLPLSKGENKDFEIIFNDGKTSKRQKIDYSPKKLITVVFKQESSVVHNPIYAKVVGTGDTQKFVFKDDIDDQEYEWIAELKKEKAQNISNKFSAQFSRVGFNESEYLRRAYQ
jgi:hypothetical protein